MQAKVIEDSISDAGVRLTTLQLRYPRFIHAEVMTHRVFSRNASSSRAIPVSKMLEQVRNEPAMPLHWGRNQPGMQAHQELEGLDLKRVQQLWDYAAYQAAETAQKMSEIGAHKQVVNRILEPFQFIAVVLTGTDWDNFFELRDHEDAQPEIRALARFMKVAMETSVPVLRSRRMGADPHESQWHLPYVRPEERVEYADRPDVLVKISTARCARVSYLTHDGQKPDLEKDLALHDRLVESRPIHASPAEHPALVAERIDGHMRFKNFRGWIQYRYEVEDAINDPARA